MPPPATGHEQRTIRVRVRPQRIAVMVPWDASAADVRRAIELLTLVWGGRYGPIIPFGPEGPQRAMTEAWLERTSPDFVYTVGVESKAASDLAMRVCRPFFCRASSGKAESDLWDSGGCDPISIEAAVQAILAANPAMTSSRVRALWQPAEDRLGAALAAKTGHGRRDGMRWFAETTKGTFEEAETPMTLASYIRHATDPQGLHLIDAGSFSVERDVIGHRWVMCPTVVLMGDLSPAVPLYWSLRMAMAPDSGKLLLLPAEAAQDDTVLASVVGWAARSKRSANHCDILCFPPERDVAGLLAERLRDPLRSQGIEQVDVGCGYHHGTCVVPVENTRQVTVAVDGRKVTVPNAEPAVAPYIRGAGNCWMVDLVYEHRDSRTPWGQIAPPPADIAYDVLNSPAPPSWGWSVIDPRRYGVDAVSLRFKQDRAEHAFVVPSPIEVLSEMLIRHGITCETSEKNPPYEATLSLFGGLPTAAASFRYPFRALLRTVLRAGPANQNKIQGEARVDTSRLRQSGQVTGDKNPTRDRVGRGRFAEWFAGEHPGPAEYLRALDYWVSRGVCRRILRLPKCANCGQGHWSPVIDLTQSTRCPSCGADMMVPGSFETGVDLVSVVRRALEQGLMPVALTARFLENLTRRSFAWFPSLSGKLGANNPFEVDIVAFCDGVTVLAECKDFEHAKNQAEGWQDAERELRTLIELAPKCAAKAVFLAALVDAFPNSVVKLTAELTRLGLPIHLLTVADLEAGHRKSSGGGFLWLPDFLPPDLEPVDWSRVPGERKGDLL